MRHERYVCIPNWLVWSLSSWSFSMVLQGFMLRFYWCVSWLIVTAKWMNFEFEVGFQVIWIMNFLEIFTSKKNKTLRKPTDRLLHIFLGKLKIFNVVYCIKIKLFFNQWILWSMLACLTIWLRHTCDKHEGDIVHIYKVF